MAGHNALQLLISKEEGMPTDLTERLTINLSKTCALLKIDQNEIQELEISKLITKCLEEYVSKDSVIWNYLCCGFHILLESIPLKYRSAIKVTRSANTEGGPAIPDDDILTVAQQKNIKTMLELIIMFGVAPHLISGVGVPLKARSSFAPPEENLSPIEKYTRLRACTMGLLKCCEKPELRKFIISRHLGDVFASLFQLSYAPIKKPTAESTSNEFEMTDILWETLQISQAHCRDRLKMFIDETYQPSAMKEIMVLMGMKNPPAPKWLKNQCSKVLCDLIFLPHGFLTLSRVLFETDSIDIGMQWNNVLVMKKLLVDLAAADVLPDFYDNITKQIFNILNSESYYQRKLNTILVRLFCTAMIERQKDAFEKQILDVVMSPIYKCAQKKHSSEFVVTGAELKQCITHVHRLFVMDANTELEIPTQPYLSPYIDVFFQLYVKSSHDNISRQYDLQDILVKILEAVDFDQLTDMINLILFRRWKQNMYRFSDDLKMATVFEERGSICITQTPEKINYALNETDESFQQLIAKLSIESQAKIFKIIFSEFCDTFTKKITDNENVILLKEDDDYVPTFAADKLLSLKILADLADNKAVMEKLDASILIKFIVKLFDQHQNTNTNHFENSEGLFLSLMLLDILIDNSIELDELKSCVEPMEAVAKETKNSELKAYIMKTCDKIRNGGASEGKEEKSTFDVALDEVTDPLLPVRAHGLITLTRLIEKKDKDACTRKQYVLCIFQENLKDTDSYIYLSAINGIAALATEFTDSVINILTEEYVKSTTKQLRDEEERLRIRMNLGEILVRVTRNLAEMAPKYKSELLNTFLTGVKDHDHLIRASSLSNLGQVCEIMGFRLGRATTEILLCLDAIIAMDKAIEVRRAGVMVLYQLIKGFGGECVTCLKDALLPIYRKLKHIYANDADDTMRLHAQLALEELNNCTKSYLVPLFQRGRLDRIFETGRPGLPTRKNITFH